MLLTQTASSAPNFILIGAGLVWQTLPAGWVGTSKSHYSLSDVAIIFLDRAFPNVLQFGFDAALDGNETIFTAGKGCQQPAIFLQ